jgi:hypothetical protein
MHANYVYKRAACYFLIKPRAKPRRSTTLCIIGTAWHERCSGPNQIPWQLCASGSRGTQEIENLFSTGLDQKRKIKSP